MKQIGDMLYDSIDAGKMQITEVTAVQIDSDLILIYPYFLKFSHR